jgi:flagellar basal-body rod protein FlgB
MINGIFNNMSITEKTLDASLIRNEVISNNIANVDTPGFKRSSVLFEEVLSNSMNNKLHGFRINNKHLPIGRDRENRVEPKVIKDNNKLSMRIDGNNVDVENEMAALAKNNIKYQLLVQNLNSGFKRLKTVINEGRR